jgi:hypothetical protein
MEVSQSLNLHATPHIFMTHGALMQGRQAFGKEERQHRLMTRSDWERASQIENIPRVDALDQLNAKDCTFRLFNEFMPL